MRVLNVFAESRALFTVCAVCAHDVELRQLGPSHRLLCGMGRLAENGGVLIHGESVLSRCAGAQSLHVEPKYERRARYRIYPYQSWYGY